MLVYDQPINGDKPRAPAEAARRQGNLALLDLWNMLWRRKAAIAFAALTCACLAVTIGKSLSPRYAATAELYIDPRELQLVDRELVPRAQDVSGLSMVVESQARLITSNSVLLRVIRENHLESDPEFGGQSRGALTSLLGLLGSGRRGADQTQLEETAALDALNRHVKVRKTERSFVVDVEVWSHEPAKSAMLANALAGAYLAESRHSQSSAARRATSDLSGRLKELQTRLHDAETALATYKAQNNFLGTQDTQISDQQLALANQRLAAAHAQTLDAQAKYDQIEASRHASSDPGAIPEALQSPTIANLRAQYAEARKRYAELSAELGPLHPSLRQMQKQVNDLRQTITEEIDRFEQSARNDLMRARDYEASLGKALDAQKRQSVRLSEAAVRLRELEREAEASREVYQAFLKRSRETQEQESLNTSASRIIGEATVPQRRVFPPAMSLIALLGLVFGALAASGWIVAADRFAAEGLGTEGLGAEGLGAEGLRAKPLGAEGLAAKASSLGTEVVGRMPQPLENAPAVLIAKPSIARLQPSDVIRTLGGILKAGGAADIARLGWPTLRPGDSPAALLAALRKMRASLARRLPAGAVPVLAMVGAGEGRSIAALNFALAAARDQVRVLLVDVDRQAHRLSDRLSRFGKSEPRRLGWLSIGSKLSRAVVTANGISILPTAHGADEAIRGALAQARAARSYDFIVLDGPPPATAGMDRKLLDLADGLVAVLPMALDLDDALDEIIAALGSDQGKLIGVVIDELNAPGETRQRSRQYA